MRYQQDLLEKLDVFNTYIESHANQLNIIYLRESLELSKIIDELRAIDLYITRLPVLTDISLNFIGRSD